MMFFTGFGILVPVIYFLGILSAQYLFDYIHGDGYYTEHLMPKIVGSFLGAVLIGALGKYLHKREKRKEYEDGPLSPNSFFFIPVRFWAHIIIGLCGVVAIYDLFNKEPNFLIQSGTSKFVLLQEGKPVFQYNKEPTEQASQVEAHFSRTGYIHPLYSPSGRIVTGDYAPDHPHQHGLFFAWTKSTFRGQPTEFWNQAKQLGDIRFSGYAHGGNEQDDKHIRFEFQQTFTAGKQNGEAILYETWEIEVPKQKTPYYQFDLTSTQKCATDDPLEILKYHYGGMAIRGSSQWIPTTKGAQPVGKIITSEGKGRKEGNHSRPRWVAMYGPVDGEVCGLVVMSHPDNFRFPQWVRLHPSMPYFVYSPMVEEPFQIAPEKPYVSKFRYITFDGEPDLALLETIWEDFSSQ